VVTLNDYIPIVGAEVVGQLHRLAERLGPRRFVHVNSTRTGGGVAEILSRAVPLLNQLGLETLWEVVRATLPFSKLPRPFTMPCRA
jgi:trehalose synthase